MNVCVYRRESAESQQDVPALLLVDCRMDEAGRRVTVSAAVWPDLHHCLQLTHTHPEEQNQHCETTCHLRQPELGTLLKNYF